MNNNKFEKVILHLTLQMHNHLQVVKYPLTSKFKKPQGKPIEQFQAEHEALAAEYADAIYALTELNNTPCKDSFFQRCRKFLTINKS